MWLCYSVLLLCSTNVLNVEVPPSVRYLFSPQMPLGELDGTKNLVKEEYFTQRLDHFDPANADVWQQRYFSCSKYYDETGGNIAFLVISEEEKASSKCLDSGLIENLATQYQARIFILEHRFFGASQPFKELYVENLRFLSSRQALEDAAMFITGMNEKYDMQKSAQWVAVGCSYSGALAAWLKMKYPHLVRGAVASGAKVLAKVDVPDRAYLFQVCTEFGWHFTSYEGSNIFGEIPIDISGTLCEDVFGAQFNMSYIQDQVDQTNMHYGGLEIDVRNVVFVYGSYDPHMSIGITKNIHPTSPAIIIKGTSHCAEWYPYENDEPKELTLARRRIIRLVGYWLKD